MSITPKDIAAHRDMIARGEALAAVKKHHAERVRLRDTFAAAALTGLLHGIPEGADIAACAADAYKIADAMLRERGRTTHDAVPEAKATNDGGTPKDADGTGNTRQPRDGALSACETVQQGPVAFAVVCKEMTGIDVYDDAYDAAEYATVLNRNGWTANVVRLVPQASPTLTDEEREAVEDAVAELTPGPIADTLRKLLQRLGGNNA